MDNQNNQQENPNQVTDMRSVQPEVIGHLRKDKIGNPGLAITLCVVFIACLISLPLVNKIIQSNSFLSTLFGVSQTVEGGNGGSITNPDPVVSYADGSKNQLLTPVMKMKVDNVVMSGFSIGDNKVTCNISSYNGTIDLDSEDYYLMVVSNSGADLGYIKLTGYYDFSEKEVTLSSSKINFNPSISYSGRIVKLTEEEYPEFKVDANDEGIGTLSCTKDNRTLTYTFRNNKLISFDDQQVVKTSSFNSIEEYAKEKGKFDDKVTILGKNVATVEEGTEGFAFRASYNLESYTIPDKIEDLNYYKLNTDAKIINFVLVSKGYDCK